MFFLKDFYSILDTGEKKRFYRVLFVIFVFSFLESLGLSLIIPYIGIINQNETILGYLNPLLERYNLLLSHRNIIFLATGIFFLVISLKSIVQMYVHYETSKFSYDFFKNKSKRLYDRYLKLSYHSFINENSSIFIKNTTATIDRVAAALVEYLLYLSYLSITTFLFVLILFENWKVSALCILIFSVLGLSIQKVFKKRQKKIGHEREHFISAVYRNITESLLTFREIRIYKKKNYFSSIFSENVSRLSEVNQKATFYPTVPVVLIEYVAILVLLGFVLFFVLSESPMQYLVAPLIFYGMVARRLLPTLNQLVSLRIKLQSHLPSIKILSDELNRPVESEEDVNAKEVPFDHSFAFREISFSYDESRKVLDDISFEVPKNTSVALVGRSGAGKTTIINLILGLIQPQKGSFVIDGEKHSNLRPLLNKIGFVPQDVAILHTSIAKNIAFGEDNINNAQLKKAIKMAHLDEFIDTLPNGIETIVGERGVKISGGQKQRLGIARALYREPEILIFDEATSSLDNLSEAMISQAIQEMSGKKTIIAIAHRLTTVQHFDCIYVLHHGKIVSSATHSDLLENCPVYQELNHHLHRENLVGATE